MKLHLNSQTGQNMFTGYGDDHVFINQQRFDKSLIVLPDQIIQDWEPTHVGGLALAHVEEIRALEPEILLLGTGRQVQFPSPEVLSPLINAQIGVEVMDIFATCRTYNILMAEGRHVAAALLMA